MKFLRKVGTLTRMNKIRNVEIRKQLRVEPMLKPIEDHQLKWFGHLIRMIRQTNMGSKKTRKETSRKT